MMCINEKGARLDIMIIAVQWIERTCMLNIHFVQKERLVSMNVYNNF